MARALDPLTGLAVHPVGRILAAGDQRVEPRHQLHQRLAQPGQRIARFARRLKEWPVEIGGLGLDPVSCFAAAAFVAGMGQAADMGEQYLDRAHRLALGNAGQPAVGG